MFTSLFFVIPPPLSTYFFWLPVFQCNILVLLYINSNRSISYQKVILIIPLITYYNNTVIKLAQLESQDMSLLL